MASIAMNPYPKKSKSKSTTRTYLARSSANSASNLSLHAIKVSTVTGSPCGMTIWKSKVGGERTKVRSSSENKYEGKHTLNKHPMQKYENKIKTP
jgi:hypothetical protein